MLGVWWADNWSTIEWEWQRSHLAGATGPLLSQPAPTLVTVGLATMGSSGQIDMNRLRQVLAEWWDRPVLRRAPDPVPVGPQPMPPLPAGSARSPVPPTLGVKPEAGTLADERLPPALREMAARMGGVPSWWTGVTGGDLAVPEGTKVGKLRRE